MIEIGNNEYRHPFRIAVLNAQNGTRGLVDANNVIIWNDDILLAINELAQLRQERDELQKRVEELEKWKSKALCQDCGSINCWPDGEYTTKESPDGSA